MRVYPAHVMAAAIAELCKNMHSMRPYVIGADYGKPGGDCTVEVHMVGDTIVDVRHYHDLTTDDKEKIGSSSGFPENVLLIEVAPGKYAANNGTTPGPDPMKLDGLAVFPDPDEATTYMGLGIGGIKGKIVKKTFEEAREIVVSKPKLQCMFLFVGGKIAAVEHVR